MDANNKLLSASLVRWTHDGKEYTEELRNRRGMPGQGFDLSARIIFALRPFHDVMADENTTTKIFFGGRQHVITEQQLQDLWAAAEAAANACGEVLEAVNG